MANRRPNSTHSLQSLSVDCCWPIIKLLMLIKFLRFLQKLEDFNSVSTEEQKERKQLCKKLKDTMGQRHANTHTDRNTGKTDRHKTHKHT